jgi:putative transposase
MGTPSGPTVAGGGGDAQEVWATFRLMVLGDLLQHPPQFRGDRRRRIQALAGQTWVHPRTHGPWRLGYSTIARWYDSARHQADPVRALRRQVRKDRGAWRAMSEAVGQRIQAFHASHPEWSAQIIYDNVAAAYRREAHVAATSPAVIMPSYQTVRRYMRRLGLVRHHRRDASGTEQAIRSERRFSRFEVDRYECTHAGALVHWDFHTGSVQLANAAGQFYRPLLIAFVDDYSRMVLHAQWYAEETARVMVHSFAQACAKYGLPRALYNDNGSAMRAAEVTEGLARLGIEHHFTRVYAPCQNGKCERFWGQVEGRLLAMVRPIAGLDLPGLNRLTAAWLAEEYARRPHQTTGIAPLDRWTQGPSVMRPSWAWDDVIRAFTMQVRRRVRRSVGTVSCNGVEFDLPSAYRHLEQVTVRVARWDLSRALLTDTRTDTIIATMQPSDPAARSDGRRRPRAHQPASQAAQAAPGATAPSLPDPAGGSALPPLLAEIMDRFALRDGPAGMLADGGASMPLQQPLLRRSPPATGDASSCPPLRP